jgi:diadenosine tetraphosphate (Ap4A) HIT family hydrolase
MYRSRKSAREYHSAPKPEACVFCELTEGNSVIEDGKYCRVVKNLYPYEQWDYHDVREHLLLVPKKHVAGLGELTPAARAEIMEFMARYEGKGYNIYARSVGSKVRTVPAHQHTHLIKVGGKALKLMVYLRKPHILHKR